MEEYFLFYVFSPWSGFYDFSLLAILFFNLNVDCSQFFCFFCSRSISRNASIPACIWNMHVFLSSRQPIGVVNSEGIESEMVLRQLEIFMNKIFIKLDVR